VGHPTTTDATIDTDATTTTTATPRMRGNARRDAERLQ
jgi:hypothetical protein